MGLADIFSILKDSLLVVASGISIYLAARNLNTWKKQLSGQADHELARKLLVHLFKYKAAIERIRNPFISSIEMRIDEELKKHDGDFERAQYIGLVNAYSARWDQLTEINANFQSYVVEARALWGDEFADIFKKLMPYENELFTAVDLFLKKDAPNLPEHKKVSYSKEFEKKKHALEIDADPPKDIFMVKFNKDYLEIVKNLRGKLHTDI